MGIGRILCGFLLSSLTVLLLYIFPWDLVGILVGWGQGFFVFCLAWGLLGFFIAKVWIETKNIFLFSHWRILGCFSSSFLPGSLSHFIASLPQLPSRVVFCHLNCKYQRLSQSILSPIPIRIYQSSLHALPCSTKSYFPWSCLEWHRLFFSKTGHCGKVLLCFLETSLFEDFFCQNTVL